ncbi:WXG100 family type VII secretion target [Mycolicibacterium setense]
MADSVEVAVSDLHLAAARMQDAGQRLQDGLSSVDLETQQLLGSGWKGDAAPAFGKVWEQWHNGAGQVVRGLQTMSQLLTVAGKEYAKTDEQAGGSISASGQSIGGSTTDASGGPTGSSASGPTSAQGGTSPASNDGTALAQQMPQLAQQMMAPVSQLGQVVGQVAQGLAQVGQTAAQIATQAAQQSAEGQPVGAGTDGAKDDDSDKDKAFEATGKSKPEESDKGEENSAAAEAPDEHLSLKAPPQVSTGEGEGSAVQARRAPGGAERSEG